MVTRGNGGEGWTFPASWWGRAEVIRGRVPHGKGKPRVAKQRSGRPLSEVVAEFDAAIEDSILPEAVAAFLSPHMPRAHSEELLSAACAWARCTRAPKHRQVDECFDYVVDTRGVDFTAQCLVVAAALESDWNDPRVVTLRPWAHHANVHIVDTHSRLRWMLAELEDDYASVIAGLARLRGLTLASDVVTSFLAPTEPAWAVDDLESFASDRVPDKWLALWLLASVTSVAEVEAILSLVEDFGNGEHSRATALWALGRYPRLVYSVCANMGPGAEYLVAELFDGNLSAKHKKLMADILVEFNTDAGLSELVARRDHKYVEPAILKAMATAPDRVYRLLAETDGATAARLRDDLERSHPEFASTAGLTSTGVAHEIPPLGLPDLLLDPPWENRSRRAKPVIIDLPHAPHRTLTVKWLPGEKEQWLHTYHSDDDGYYHPPRQELYLQTVANAPEASALEFLSEWPIPTFLYGAEPTLQRILARFDDAAADFVYRVAASRPGLATRALLPVEGTAVCAAMLDWFTSKSIRPIALEWFQRHVDTAAADLVVHTLRVTGSERLRAEELLGRLNREGHRDRLMVAAGECGGDAARVEVARILDTDPLHHLPARVPSVPDWLAPQLLSPVALQKDGRVLPPQAVDTITTMLAMSRIGDEYAGIAIVEELVGRPRLAVLTRDIFNRWAAAGYPPAQDWALHALAIAGDDTTVALLIPFIQKWPLESAHRRAATGLEVLAGIATDAALHALWQIAEGLRYPALRKKAHLQIQSVADTLGLTPLDLADRVIPRLGFDDQSRVDVDYGWTRFTVRLDTRLRPTITDAAGGLFSQLPAPTDSETPEAEEAYSAFVKTQRELKTVAVELIRRLEAAMISEREWSLATIRLRYLAHPLMWPLCSALVWMTDGGVLFRFADPTREPVDSMGRELSLPEQARIRVVHPVTLGDDLTEWRDVFERLAVEQPVEQLWRPVFDGELADELQVYQDVKVATRELLLLRGNGWVREGPQDKGAQIAIHKPLGRRCEATMRVFPGFNIANANQWRYQRIVDVFISADEQPNAIYRSELVRDLKTLRTRRITSADSELVNEALGFFAE